MESTKNKFWEDTLVGNAQYEVLRSIDPTEMEPEDSILKIVLSQMYVHFQTVYEQECDNTASSYSLREQLAGQLQEKFLHCFHLADLLNDDKRKSPPANAEDEMEFISETGGGVNFRKVLCELFEEYLFFITGGENSYLVIPIDDADLNIGRVYSMLEDIRKYLQLPRIIILTATNITQLESIVEQHFLEEYGTALKHPHSMVDIAKCHHIAESYLEKILPGSRRLYLPSLYDEVKSLNSFRVEYIEAGQSSGKTRSSTCWRTNTPRTGQSAPTGLVRPEKKDGIIRRSCFISFTKRRVCCSCRWNMSSIRSCRPICGN